MVDDEIIFTEDEVNLYRMIYCMFNVDNNDLLLTYLSDIISEKIKYSNYNLNKDLFIDNLICEICGGSND